jgi:hypothetical protein
MTARWSTGCPPKLRQAGHVTAHGLRRLVHGGRRRFGVTRRWRSIEADHCDVVRDPAPAEASMAARLMQRL